MDIDDLTESDVSSDSSEDINKKKMLDDSASSASECEIYDYKANTQV